MRDDFIVREVQQLLDKGSLVFERAWSELPHEFLSTIPEFLTPEKTLQVWAKLMKQQAENVQKIFEPIDEEGRSFWEDQERAVRFLSSARVDLAINDEE